MNKAERAAENQRYSQEKPLKDWLYAMEKSDSSLPRYVEDIIDSFTKTAYRRLPDFLKESYISKKSLRKRKPVKLQDRVKHDK